MVYYLKSHRRWPVWVGQRPFVYDRQGAIPDGWCEGCGMEVFGMGKMCRRCKIAQNADLGRKVQGLL